MKKNILLIAILASIKFILQFIGNRNYGFHRDELLHLSVSEHLAWGFMEFPPFIGLIGKMSYLLFDYSLLGTRVFPTLAGVGILILCCKLAKEFSGNSYAILLAGISVLAFLPFYRNHTLFQPVAFDQLFWTLGFYYLVRFLNTENKNYLLFTGITLGVGLLNKYTILIWAFGVFVGMIFYQRGKIFKNKWWYISGLISLIIFLPNIIWQYSNKFPFLGHLEELGSSQLDQINPMEFGLDQLNYPFTLIVSILGLVFLFGQKKYKSMGIAAIIIFFTMWLLHAKSYYVFALYPILFAAGAVKITNWLKNKKAIWIYVIAGFLFISSAIHIPHATPILSIEDYVQYANLKEKNGRVELTGDYADMFGWEEQVKIIDSLYHSLHEEKKRIA